MNKKTLTTAILSLSFLTAASTAYADGNDDFIQKQLIGGAGDGPVAMTWFRTIGAPQTLSKPIGGAAIKLNGKLVLIGDWDEHDEYHVKKGSFHGDAFFTALIKRNPLIKENLDVWCDVHPVRKIKNEFWFKCDYFLPTKRDLDDWSDGWNKAPKENPFLTSKGQCYIDVRLGLSDLFKMNDRNAACNFVIKRPIREITQEEGDELFMSFEEGLELIDEEFLDQVVEQGRFDFASVIAFPLLFNKNSLT